jgi:biopolymer transport protein TolQ
MNPITLFWHASFLVKIIMLVLLMLSLFSWTLIFYDTQNIRREKKDVFDFFNQFWSGSPINDLFQAHQNVVHKNSAEQMFCAGYQTSLDTPGAFHNIERRMRIVQSDRMTQLTSRLHWLATISSTSPYIGLLGTVFGIIHTFQALSMAEQASLSMIAPGISEALVTTAMALLVAIPASIAYNRLVAWLQLIDEKLITLQKSLIFTLEHHAKPS